MNPRTIRVMALAALLGGAMSLCAQTAPLPTVEIAPELERTPGITPLLPDAIDADKPATAPAEDAPQIYDPPPVEAPPAQDVKPEPIEPSQELHPSTAEFRTDKLAEQFDPLAADFHPRAVKPPAR